jgi:hypothetical protein
MFTLRFDYQYLNITKKTKLTLNSSLLDQESSACVKSNTLSGQFVQ